MECLNCEYCKYEEYSSGISRYYCKHPNNPDYIKKYGSSTLIAKTKRHDCAMTRKRTPNWCPNKNLIS